MSRMFEDTNEGNITNQEKDAIKQILQSSRCAILIKLMLQAMSEMDDKAPAFLLTTIPNIVKIQMDKAADKCHSMSGWVSYHGRALTMDCVTKGKDKGTPRFLTKKFKGFLELGMWDVLVYIYHFTNFKDFYTQYELGIYSEPRKASDFCCQDDLAKVHILRFCKFLDDLDTHNIEDLVSPLIFKHYPGMEEFVKWCRANRTWDDISRPTKTNKKTRKVK